MGWIGETVSKTDSRWLIFIARQIGNWYYEKVCSKYKIYDIIFDR